MTLHLKKLYTTKSSTKMTPLAGLYDVKCDLWHW